MRQTAAEIGPAAEAEVLIEVLVRELLLIRSMIGSSGRLPRSMAAVDVVTLGVRDLRRLVSNQPHLPASALTR